MKSGSKIGIDFAIYMGEYMEILKDKYTETEYEQDQLVRILAIAAIIDIITTTGVLASFGVGVVIEEAVEYFISQQIAKYGKIKLTKFDNTVGMLPIPGVTAVTVHCARKLMKLKITY